MQLICVYFLAGTLGQLAPATNAASALAPASLPTVVVEGRLDEARAEIVPALGATDYTLGQDAIAGLSQGDNIPFDQLLLRLPGVSEDSTGSGSFHVRDDHGNVQYRINDVLNPEGITGFGGQFDTNFADKLDLITGALPAQYGFRTTAILDVHTRNGAFDPGGDVEFYGGSHETMRTSVEDGGSDHGWDYYFSGSYLQSTLGIENPTASASAIHDDTGQYRGFAYLSKVIGATSRVSLIAGEAYNQFEIPNSPGEPAGVDGAGNPFAIPGVGTFDAAALRETQGEQNNFEVAAYQVQADELNLQAALFNRYSNVFFRPDEEGDLYFNGVAGWLDRSVMSNGAQFDASYALGDEHTLRGGFLLDAEGATQTATTTVLPENPLTGAQDGAPFSVFDHGYETAYSYGFYLQDEWKATKALTINFGGRFDLYQSTEIRQNQLSPRLNATWEIDPATTGHAGYASYFTPPPLENIPQGSVAQFAGTTNAATPGLPNGPVESERDHYFDVGLLRHFTPAYQAGVEGYYKFAQNLIDDGQFGAAPILSAFNYRRGKIGGVEVSQSYATGNFFTYANFAIEKGTGTEVNSAQAVLFDANDYHYIAGHSVYLDHSQTFTGSLGLSYLIGESRPSLEMVCASGLRTDIDGVPNGGSLPAYDAVNLGFSQGFKWAGLERLTARFDMVNLFDQVYELRNGIGIGVFAPQYGERRGFYGGLGWAF